MILLRNFIYRKREAKTFLANCFFPLAHSFEKASTFEKKKEGRSRVNADVRYAREMTLSNSKQRDEKKISYPQHIK